MSLIYLDLPSPEEEKKSLNQKESNDEDSKRLKIVSQAYPPNKTQKGDFAYPLMDPVSKVHNLIKNNKIELKLDEIEFKNIQPSNMKELEDLHLEWFPIKYEKEYYTSIANSKKFIKLCCIFNQKIKMKSQNKYKNKQFMIGACITRMEDNLMIYDLIFQTTF